MNRGRRRRLLSIAVVAVVGWCGSACDVADPGMEGDCHADLVFGGVRYEVRSDLDNAPVGPQLGTADVVDCRK